MCHIVPKLKPAYRFLIVDSILTRGNELFSFPRSGKQIKRSHEFHQSTRNVSKIRRNVAECVPLPNPLYVRDTIGMVTNSMLNWKRFFFRFPSIAGQSIAFYSATTINLVQ